MDESKGHLSAQASVRWDLVVLGAILAGLGSVIALSQSGIMAFMQSLEEGNMLSIAALVSLIAVIFIFLHRLGISLVYVEEIESQKP